MCNFSRLSIYSCCYYYCFVLFCFSSHLCFFFLTCLYLILFLQSVYVSYLSKMFPFLVFMSRSHSLPFIFFYVPPTSFYEWDAKLCFSLWLFFFSFFFFTHQSKANNQVMPYLSMISLPRRECVENVNEVTCLSTKVFKKTFKIETQEWFYLCLPS